MILDQKDLRLYRLRSSQHKPGVWLRAPEIVPGVREGAHRPKMLLTKAASTQVLQRPILAEEALIGLGREVVDSRRKVARHPGSKMCLFSRQNQHQSIAWSTRLQPAAPPARCGMELRVAPPRSSACTGGTCSTAGQLGPVVVSCPRHQNTSPRRKRNPLVI